MLNLSAQPNLAADVAIIGAGIVGLITAYRLNTLHPEWKILIFEQDSRPGGRLMSKRPDPNGPVMEFGAGRFNTDKHPRLKQLLDEFGIEVQPYNYPCGEMSSQGEFSKGARASLDRLLDFANGLSDKEKSAQSFREAAERCLSRDEVDHLICAIGYDSLNNPDFKLQNGLYVMLHHPEAPIPSPESAKWMSPSAGFQCLVEKIVARLKGSCELLYGHRLISTQQVQNDAALPFRLDFLTEHGQCQVAARAVICATHLRELSEIKHPSNDTPMHIDSLLNVSCTKGYIRHPTCWWQNSTLAGRCVTTRLPFRKLYFPTRGRAYLFYSDGQSAVDLNAMLAARTAVPALIAEINSYLPLTEQQQSQLAKYDYEWIFWPSAVAFFKEDTGMQNACVLEQASNFIICSDAFTGEHAGFIEGSLLSSAAAVKRLTGSSQ